MSNRLKEGSHDVEMSITHPTLERLYPTLAQLRETPELQPFLRRVRGQPVTRRTRPAPRRRKIGIRPCQNLPILIP
jgi:hypothetical protein